MSTLFFVSDYHLFVAKPTATSFTYGFRADVTRIVADIIKGAAAVPGLRMTFTIGFWLLLSTALTVASGLLYVRGRMQSYTAFLISLSGFFYIAPLVVIGVAPDLRYAYFTIGATCVAVVYFIPSRVTRVEPEGIRGYLRGDAPGGNQGPASLLQHPAAR